MNDYITCQTFCDEDKKCKGFSQKSVLKGVKYKYYCAIATGGECLKGWELHDDWKVGKITTEHDCNWYLFGYNGCFVKNFGKLTI